jgi:hypothetical protein
VAAAAADNYTEWNSCGHPRGDLVRKFGDTLQVFMYRGAMSGHKVHRERITALLRDLPGGAPGPLDLALLRGRMRVGGEMVNHSANAVPVSLSGYPSDVVRPWPARNQGAAEARRTMFDGPGTVFLGDVARLT